jgi:tetratricopeptide (TPR) repeat protein
LEISTMLAPLPSVEAFRRDAVSPDSIDLDDGILSSWLESATRLERAAMTSGPTRERLLLGLLARHDVVAFPDAPLSNAAVFSTVTDLAAEMEDQACFRLAHSVLATLLLVLPESEAGLRGRVIAQQARVARHLGEREAAARYYQEVEALGVEHQLPDLLGRAWYGLGLLDHQRGVIPEGRRRFRAVIELEGAAAESVGYSHHQLMVGAATAGDYDTAAEHGWKAFRGASTSGQETEALLNLAQLLLEAGHARAALRGFAAALARKPILRHELPILGGAACAAAAALPRAAARALVRNFADRGQFIVKALRNGEALAYPSASALVELSEALNVVGESERAREAADQADRLASAHGFYQLTYRLENPVLVAEPTPLAPSTQEIIAAVDELEGAELVAVG